MGTLRIDITATTNIKRGRKGAKKNQKEVPNNRIELLTFALLSIDTRNNISTTL